MIYILHLCYDAFGLISIRYTNGTNMHISSKRSIFLMSNSLIIHYKSSMVYFSTLRRCFAIYMKLNTENYQRFAGVFYHCIKSMIQKLLTKWVQYRTTFSTASNHNYYRAQFRSKCVSMHWRNVDIKCVYWLSFLKMRNYLTLNIMTLVALLKPAWRMYILFRPQYIN